MGSASSGNKPQSRHILLLKDYLRDDMSSCSSSGFKSFPRRQCCLHPRYSSSSSSSCSGKSTLLRASEVVLNVIKSLQIPVPLRSPSSSLPQTRRRKGKKGILSRSFSRRLMSRNFWRRASSSKGDSNNNKACTFVSLASSASANGDDNSTWVDTTDIEGSVTTTTTAINSCSVTNSTREWQNEEKEQQFSPVSVLDCPLFDDDEDITSPFNSTPCSNLEEGRHSIPLNDNNDDVDNLMKKQSLCKEAEDWMRGQHQEQYLSWEERDLYIIKEMDKCWSNNNSDDEEIECVARGFELEFFTSLLIELLLDLTTT